MKIEIEYAEVENLKRQIERQEKEIKTLETELKSLDKNKLHSDAIELSRQMFNQYVTAIFAKLGFADRGYACGVIFEDNLEHWLGKNWYTSDRLRITFGATVTETFKSAFLSLGIITKDSDK